MAKVDLSDYNFSELKGLQLDIEKEIKNRQKQGLKKAREQVLAIAQDLGVSVDELLLSPGTKAKGIKTEKVAPRYKNPADNAQTWSGRGRQPKWIVDALANGKQLNDLLIG